MRGPGAVQGAGDTIIMAVVVIHEKRRWPGPARAREDWGEMGRAGRVACPAHAGRGRPGRRPPRPAPSGLGGAPVLSHRCAAAPRGFKK